MAQEPGFRLRDRFYPYPTSRKTTDAALLEQITGLTARDWTERYLESFDQDADDELVSLGVLALAVSRVHPGWSRDKIVRFLDSVDWDEVEPVGEPVEEDDVRPPESDPVPETEPEEPTPGKTTTEPPSESSNGESAVPSNRSPSQETTGTSESATSPEARLALAK